MAAKKRSSRSRSSTRKPAASKAASKATGKKRTLGLAMVGHAFMGKAHSNAVRQVNRFFDLPVEIVPKVVVGRDLERARATIGKFGFEEASDDLREVLARDDIDIVDVATPNDTHYTVAMAALRAGKHVLCEKPLALNMRQAKAMAAEARKRKAKVGLWHNYRRCPAASLAKKMIDRGDIGLVRQVRAVYLQDWLADASMPASWRTDKKVCGSGAHGDLNAHLIDMTMFLTGLTFAEVCAVEQTFTKTRKGPGGKRTAVTVDDAFAFLARFSNGAIGTFEATRVAPGRKNYNQIEINGTKGSIVWNLERMNELAGVHLRRQADDAPRLQAPSCAWTSVHPYAAHWWPDGHIIGYEHTFVHHARRLRHDASKGAVQRARSHPNFDDGVAVQAVLDASLKAARDGRRWVARCPARVRLSELTRTHTTRTER